MPALNRKCCFEFSVWKFVCFYESVHAFKTIWRLPCLCYLIKIKGHFFKVGNGICVLFEFLPGINSETNALTVGIYSYNNNKPVRIIFNWR